MIIINISGPPGIGKTSICKALSSAISNYGIKTLCISLTGFHYASFIASQVLLQIFILLGKASFSSTKVHPYDCIPQEYLKPLLKLAYFLEFMSIYCKVLVLFLKIIILKPKIILIDEGFPHVMFNYTMFYYVRGSSFHLSLNRHLIRILAKLSQRFDVKMLLILPTNILSVAEGWRSRDSGTPNRIILQHLQAYYMITPLFIKLLKNLPVEVAVFNDLRDGLSFILKHVLMGIRG